jgi:hypothetical protein
MAKTVRYVPTFRAPTEYERQVEEARRRAMLAEALAQQQYEPMEGNAAPIPKAAPLVKALQGFMTARAGRQAQEAAEETKGMEADYAQRMLGRMQGGYTYQPDAELETQMAKRPEETLDQYTQRMQATPFVGRAAPVPEQTELAEVTRQSQYRRAPEEALGMASTSLGTAALKDRPLMAQRLAQMLEKKPTDYEIEKTSKGFVRIPKAGGEASFVTMGGETVMPRDEYSLGMSPKEQAQYNLDVARFGVDQAQFNLARTRAADEGIDVSGISMPKGITPVRQPAATGAPAVPAAAAPTPPAAAPTAPRPAPVPGASKVEAQPPATGEKRRVPLIESPNLGGKQKRELLLLEPQTRARAASTQAEIQSLVDMANDLKNHPGLKEITGKLGQYSVTDLSPLAREARGIYDALRYRSSLLKTSMVREANTTGGAFGNMTEQEWPRLESAFGNISNAQDAAGLQDSLNNYVENVSSMGKTNLGIYEDTYGKLDWTPIKYQFLSRKYGEKSKPGPSSRGRGGQWGRATVVSQ